MATALNLLHFGLTLEHLGGVSDLAQTCGTDGIRAAGGGRVELWALLLFASTALNYLSRHAGFCVKELGEEENKGINSEGLKEWEGMKETLGKILAVEKKKITEKTVDSTAQKT